jgi:hypothetical protein
MDTPKLTRQRCNELRREFYAAKPDHLVMVKAAELRALIDMALRDDPKEQSNKWWRRQRDAQKAKEAAGVR